MITLPNGQEAPLQKPGLYRTRNGRIVEIVRSVSENDELRWAGFLLGGRLLNTWSAYGQHQAPALDIVAEVPKGLLPVFGVSRAL
jgi:hypothetical protein